MKDLKLSDKIGHVILYLIIRLLHATWRYDFIGKEHQNEAESKSDKNNYVMTTWHEFMIPGLIVESKRDSMLIASRSGGGRMIGSVMERFGMNVTYGSQNRDGKDKGGKEAKEALMNALDQGMSPSVTVDGSVGPRRFCKAGAIVLSKKKRAPILPMATLASSYWALRTWDRLQIPKPFSRIIISYEKPFEIAENCAGEDFFNAQLEAGKLINKAEQNAKKYLFEKYGIEKQLPDIAALAKDHPSYQP